MENKKSLWEILVPRFSNTHEEFGLEFHKKWDEKVREISGGLTVLKTAKGYWVNSKDKLFVEEMIPVRIYCSEEEMDKIMNYTLNYYNQEAVMSYIISDKVKILNKNDNR